MFLEIVNKKRKQILIIICAIIIIFLYKGLPAIMVSKPQIDDIMPGKVVEGVQYDEDYTIKLFGHGLENVHAVYINEVFAKDVVIISKTDEEIALQIPRKYYNLAQQLQIKLEARISSDLFCYSNIAVMEVMAEDIISQPQIERIEPETLYFSGKPTQNIIVYGMGFNKDSRVIINNNEFQTVYDEENGSLIVEVSYYDWCKEEQLDLCVVQTYNGYPSSRKSNTYTMTTEYKEWNALKNIWFKNNYSILEISENLIGASQNRVEDIVLQNYSQGQRVFGIQFAFSEDCILYTSLKDTSDFGCRLPDTYTQIRARQEREGRLIPCSFDVVCKLLSQHKDMYIVIDISEPNEMNAIYMAYKYIVEEAKKVDEAILDNFVVQIDSEEKYRLISAIYPFSAAMFDLESAYLNGQVESALDFIERAGIKTVNISVHLLSEELIQKLRAKGIRIYVNGAENIGNIGNYLKNGVHGMVFNRPIQTGQRKEIEEWAAKSRITSIEDMEAFFEEVKKTEYICFCSIKDDATIGLSEEVYKAICGLGAKEYPISDIRSSYILISCQGEVLAEEVSNDSDVVWVGMLDDRLEVNIVSAGFHVGNDASIVINGIEYSMNERGINIVLYDRNEEKVIDSLNFDVYEGGKVSRKLLPIDAWIYESVMYDGYELFLDYLSKVGNDRYITALSIADDASSNMTEEIQDALFQLGLKEALIGSFRQSYIAVIDGKNVIYEDKGEQMLTFAKEIDGLKIEIESAGGNVDGHANIKIDGMEYAQNCRGINMVVYDKFLDTVCDSICFDLYNGYDVIRE